LLGIASKEDEQRTEEAILAGDVNSADIDTLEDRLIDDFIFGDLSPDEERAFTAHFLSTEERRQRLNFARALMRYVQNQPSVAPEIGRDSLRSGAQRSTLPWPRSTVAALAASILLACLVGFQQIILHRKAQTAESAQNEIITLQSDLADRDSRPPADSAQEVHFVLPRVERDALHPTVLHIPLQARLVWIDLHLILPSTGTYTVELIKANQRLWSQELGASEGPTADKSIIVLPAYLLTSGQYLIQLDTAHPVPQEFWVKRY
jgi:hypothetical protein